MSLLWKRVANTCLCEGRKSNEKAADRSDAVICWVWFIVCAVVQRFIQVSAYGPRNSNTKEHDNGDHHFDSVFDAVCVYRSAAPTPTRYCDTTSSTQASIFPDESGDLSNL